MKSQPTPDDFLSSFLALCGRLKEVRGQRYEHLPFQSEFATTTVNNSFLLENDPISINEASRPLSIFFKYSLDPQIHAAFSLNNSAKWHQRVHERLAALVLSLEISGKRNVADELQDLLAKLYLFAEFAEQMATGSLLADEYLRILWVLLRCADLLDSHTPMQGLRLHIDGSDTIPSEISLSSDVLSSQSGISVASDHVSDNPSAAFRRPFSSSTPFAVSLSVGNIKSDHEVPNVIAYDAQPGPSMAISSQKESPHMLNQRRSLFGALLNNPGPPKFDPLNVTLSVPELGRSPASISGSSRGGDGAWLDAWPQMEKEFRSIKIEGDIQVSEDVWTRIRHEATQAELQSWDTLSAPLTDDESQQQQYLIVEASPDEYEGILKNYLGVYSGRQAIGVISDDTLLKDILNVTVGIESKTFEYLARDKAFRVARPQSDAFRIKTCGPASLSSYLQRFANIGTNLVRLEFVANVMRQDISSYGQIGLAFAHSMSSFLSFIKTCLVAVPNMLNLRTEYQHESRLALSRLYEAYRDPDYFLSILATICGFENVNSIESNYEPPRGGVLLSRLYDAACTLGGIINHESEGKPLNEHFQKRDQVLQLIIFGFIQHASRPYFTWIEQWLGLPASGEEKFETLGGLLEQMTDVWDPYEEFFIKNFSESTNEEILQPETAGDLFWTNGWQINRNVTIPSFLESGVARQLLHAGKYLRLLRHCQPHHPLVQLQDQGTEIRSLLRHHGRLRWMWLARDAKLFLETSDVVVSAIKETVTSQQRRAKADSVRDNHHDEGGLSLKERVALAAEKHLIEDKERKAALIEEQLREQEKKQSLQAEIDTFKDDQAAFAKRSQEQETAQKLQEQQRDEAAKQKRQQFVQEEKKRLLAEYKAKMDRLQKREDILRWQASRLALHERRKALLKDERNIETVSTDIDTRESTSPGGATFGEDPNLHDAMTETAEEINTALRIKDVDQNPTIAPGRPSIAVEANPISLGEEGILLSETPRSEDVVHPVTAKTGAETITFPVPAKEGKGFSDPNVSSVSHRPATPIESAMINNDTNLAHSFPQDFAIVPSFADMASLSQLLSDSPLSPFFAPGFETLEISPDDGNPPSTELIHVEDEDADRTDTLSASFPEHANQSPPSLATEPEVPTPSQHVLPSIENHRQSAVSGPPKYQVAESSRTHNTQQLPENDAHGLPQTFSFAQFIEDNLPVTFLVRTSEEVVSFHSGLQLITSQTLHTVLSNYSSLISRYVTAALAPGLRLHFSISGRYRLLRDYNFSSNVVSALFDENCSLDIDGRRDAQWPPGFAEIAAALDKVVPETLVPHDPANPDVGTLNFSGDASGQDTGLLDAISFLNLRYIPPSPFEVVFSEATDIKYDRIFGFLIKLQRVRKALERTFRGPQWQFIDGRLTLSNTQTRDTTPGEDSMDEGKACQQLHWEAGAFVRGLLRFSVEFGVGKNWDKFEELFSFLVHDDMDTQDQPTLDLEEIYQLHHQMLDRILWSLLLRSKQRPVMIIIEGMLQIVLRFCRQILGSGGISGEKSAKSALDAFRKRHGMLIKVLRGMIDREVSGVHHQEKSARPQQTDSWIFMKQQSVLWNETISFTTLLECIEPARYLKSQ